MGKRKHPQSRNHPITKPLPRAERETSFNFLAGDDECDICTTDPVVARKLERKGYEPTEVAPGGESARYVIPRSAITIRSRQAVENPHQGKNLPKRSVTSVKVGRKPSKVGGKRSRDSTITDPEGGREPEGANETESTSKSSKVGKVDTPEDVDSNSDERRSLCQKR